MGLKEEIFFFRNMDQWKFKSRLSSKDGDTTTTDNKKSNSGSKDGDTTNNKSSSSSSDGDTATTDNKKSNSSSKVVT